MADNGHRGKTFAERELERLGQLCEMTGSTPEKARDFIMAQDKLREPRRPKAPIEIPEGGMSVRAVARRHHMDDTTILNWVHQKYIPILLKTKKTTYIDSAKADEIIKAFKKEGGGKGKWTMRKLQQGLVSS